MKPTDETVGSAAGLRSGVTVSLVLYNSRRLLESRREFLASLPSLCLVDNASTDGSADWIATHLPQARLLRCEQNLGFGRGHNLAVAGCQTPFALLLNPDCDISEDSMQGLVECLQRYPEALLAVPRLEYPDGRPQENHRGFTHTGGRPGPGYRTPDAATCCEMVSGAAMMVRVEHFRAIGGFDPWFFLYFEDEEICWRANQHRMPVILEPAAVARHALKQSSTPSLRTEFVRNYSYVTSKLYLRRKLREHVSRTVLRATALLFANLLGLVSALLSLNRLAITRRLARIGAVLTLPWQLRREQAAAIPWQLRDRRRPARISAR